MAKFSSGTLTVRTNGNSAQSSTTDNWIENLNIGVGLNHLDIQSSIDGLYRVTVKRPGKVSSLLVGDSDGNPIVISPPFTPGKLTGYVGITTPYSQSLVITATFSAGSMTATVGSAPPAHLDSGSALHDPTATSLSVGNNILSLDHVDDGLYVVTLKKPVLSWLRLEDQSGNPILLTPKFEPGFNPFLLSQGNLASAASATSVTLGSIASAPPTRGYFGTQDFITIGGETRRIASYSEARVVTVHQGFSSTPNGTAAYLLHRRFSESETSSIVMSTATSLRITTKFSAGALTAKVGMANPSSVTSMATLSDASATALSPGSNTLTLSHTGSSADGDYVISLYKPMVTALVIKDQDGNSITFSPGFVSGALSGYSGTAFGASTSLKVTVTFAGLGNVFVSTNNNHAVPATSGLELSDASSTSLSLGSNVLTIFHPTDGTYKFLIYRPYLISLAIQD
jgi:hypothetical protein